MITAPATNGQSIAETDTAPSPAKNLGGEQGAWAAAVANKPATEGNTASGPVVTAIIGAGCYSQKDTGLRLIPMLMDGQPLRLVGPGNNKPSLRATVPFAGQMPSNANNVQFSTTGTIMSQQGDALGQGVAPTSVLNSATLKAHQNTGLVFNTLASGTALHMQLASLPAKAMVINTNDPLGTTQLLAILRPDITRNYGLVSIIAEVNGVPDLFGPSSPNGRSGTDRAIPEGLAATRKAQEARELAAVLSTGSNEGTSIAAVALDVASASALSMHVSSTSGQDITIPAGTVIAAPVAHGTGQIDMPTLMRAVDIDPGQAAATLERRVESRSVAADRVARSIGTAVSSAPMRGVNVLQSPRQALRLLGSEAPRAGTQPGNTGSYTVANAAEYRQVLGKTTVVGVTGSIGGLQLAQLIGKNIDVSAVSRNNPPVMPHGVQWSAEVPADTKTVFLSASVGMILLGNGTPDRAAMLNGNLTDIVAPLVSTLPHGATVVVTTNPVNEITSILKATRPDLNVVADGYSDLARTRMFSATQPGSTAPLVLGPHNDAMISTGTDGKLLPQVPRYGLTVAMMSRNPNREPQSSTTPTAAASISGSVDALSGRKAIAAPVLGEANAARLSRLVGFPVNPQLSFAAPYSFNSATKAWTLDTAPIQQFLAGQAGSPAVHQPANVSDDVAYAMSVFAAQPANRVKRPEPLARAINQEFGTAITQADATQVLNAPTTRLLMLQSAVQAQHEAWSDAADAVATMVNDKHPEVSTATVRNLIEQGGRLSDGRNLAALM